MSSERQILHLPTAPSVRLLSADALTSPHAHCNFIIRLIDMPVQQDPNNLCLVAVMCSPLYSTPNITEGRELPKVIPLVLSSTACAAVIIEMESKLFPSVA